MQCKCSSVPNPWASERAASWELLRWQVNGLELKSETLERRMNDDAIVTASIGRVQTRKSGRCHGASVVVLVDTIGVLVQPMAVCAADRLAAAGAQSQLFVTGRREDEMGEQLAPTSAFARSVTFGRQKEEEEK
jgi:hypothetical protein